MYLRSVRCKLCFSTGRGIDVLRACAKAPRTHAKAKIEYQHNNRPLTRVYFGLAEYRYAPQKYTVYGTILSKFWVVGHEYTLYRATQVPFGQQSAGGRTSIALAAVRARRDRQVTGHPVCYCHEKALVEHDDGCYDSHARGGRWFCTCPKSRAPQSGPC